MKLPVSNGRLFVAGIAPGTVTRTSDATSAATERCPTSASPRTDSPASLVASPSSNSPTPLTPAAPSQTHPRHVINGQQVHVARAKPRIIARYKPLCQRIYRGIYRVGDMLTMSLDPLGDDYEECEYVNKLKEFGDIIDNRLTFQCCVGYISEDGKECLVRWPPVKRNGHGKPAALSSRQGDIVPSWTFPMKDLAQFASTGNFASAYDCRYCLGPRFSGCTTTAHSSCFPNAVGDAPSVESNTKSTCLIPEAAGRPQNSWCWLVLYGS